MTANKDKFFSRLDWAAFWTATLATLAVYLWTLGPSVGLEDSGELATAAANLGVPHPPGYPFWTLCSWIFCKLFGWVTYMGHPTPAWAVSCCSAVFGAFAAGCTAMLICRSSCDFLFEDDAPSMRYLAFGGAVGGALTFALSPVEWSQSTIVEIYSLNALFLMWVFLLSYRWMRKPSDKILFITAFVFGLGLTNYQVLLFAIVPLALIILLRNITMFRDVVIYMLPVGMVYQLMSIGCLNRADFTMDSDVIAKHIPFGITSGEWAARLKSQFGIPNSLDISNVLSKAPKCPSTTFLVIGIATLAISLVVAAVLRQRGRDTEARKAVLWGGGVGAAIIALCTTVFVGYAQWKGVNEAVAPLIDPRLYVWIGAFVAASVVAAVVATFGCEDLRHPDKRTLQYLGIAAACAFIAIVIALSVESAKPFVVTDEYGRVFRYRGKEFPWGGCCFSFFFMAALFAGLCATTKKGIALAIPALGLHISAFILLKSGAMNGLTHPSSWWFWWPIAWNLVLLPLVWLTLPNGRSVAGAAFFAQLGVSFYAYMPIVSDLRNPPMNWGYPRTWEGFKHAIQRGQYEAIGFKMPQWSVLLTYFEDVRVQFTDLLIPFAAVPFAAGHWIVRKENRKQFWQWMIPAFACFLMMSVLLIALANVKGDIQDGFIQKVKFISSHAMLALWIGYGLVFAAVYAFRRFLVGKPSELLRKIAIATAAAMIAVSFAYPLIDNYCGNYVLGVNEVAFKLGGSEQNGHTFGWQFGAYQLDGAKAINEQLIADEEPLPDPQWPAPMEPYSIFFGGTDPGRFVPTYMIYSADFRPDVYLITQNALADDTYMSVQRDLYGDEIWIPAKEDSESAFSRYLDEVKRGVRQANGDIKTENGRVQVTGALGVMEINGILTQMMFEHDRTRHAFYIEESYQIQWMYPYLSPHGLIMKINKDPTPYDAKTASKDQDFWDWYQRRLLRDPMYGRDFAGQKSFSKLRASIAGLYAKQNRRAEAAQAYREACLLYPASPEASFRYAQELLLPARRWDVVLELLDYTDKIDPNNQRTERLREYVKPMRDTYGKIDGLKEKIAEGKITRAEMYQLMQDFYKVGRIEESASIAKRLAADEVVPEHLLFLSMLLTEAGANEDAEKVTLEYLKKVSSPDPLARLNMARLMWRTDRKAAAVEMLRIAGESATSKADKDFIIKRITQDRELAEIAKHLTDNRR